MSDFTASNGVQVRPGRVAGLHITCNGDGKAHDLSDGETEALREFFQQERDEQSGRQRKPWEDAKTGEAWLIGIDGGDEAVMIADCTMTAFPRFLEPIDGMSYGPQAGITSGRRIWPEDGS